MSKHYCPVISCALVVLSYYRISWFCSGSFFCGLLATRPSKPQTRRYPPLRASNPWQAWFETCTCKKWLWGLAHKSGILLCEHVHLQACPLLHDASHPENGNSDTPLMRLSNSMHCIASPMRRTWLGMLVIDLGLFVPCAIVAKLNKKTAPFPIANFTLRP